MIYVFTKNKMHFSKTLYYLKILIIIPSLMNRFLVKTSCCLIQTLQVLPHQMLVIDQDLILYQLMKRNEYQTDLHLTQ